MGRHVVSVKGTPGHTKHLQTHFLADGLRLCDCPGLVFPAVDIPRPMQVRISLGSLLFVFRQPFTRFVVPLLTCLSGAHGYLSCGALSRSGVGRTLPCRACAIGEDPQGAPKQGRRRTGQGAIHCYPPSYLGRFLLCVVFISQPYVWSAYTLCEAYAEQRGFYTRKGGRPDVNRAANLIIRNTYNGQILLAFPPPGTSLGIFLFDSVSVVTFGGSMQMKSHVSKRSLRPPRRQRAPALLRRKHSPQMRRVRLRILTNSQAWQRTIVAERDHTIGTF